jgi:ribosomal RNA-processing protein 1
MEGPVLLCAPPVPNHLYLEHQLTPHTGLWMQDKPALQQALSRDLASLVSSIRTPLVLPFLRAFFATIAREWSHIEALRLDKYLYLIRQYMNASFQFLSRQKWDMKIIEEWNAIMAAVPLNTMDQTIPNGLRYHVLDVWVDEMEKVAGKKWEKEKGSDELEALVQPIEGLKTGAKLKTVKLAARECLADPRLMTWRNMVDEEIEEQEVVDEEEDAEWGGFADE